MQISKQLLSDQEDLIHKAVGWMLREVGKRNLAVETGFLKLNYKTMPRTMLRYAIEKFSKEERQKYLSGKVCQEPNKAIFSRPHNSAAELQR